MSTETGQPKEKWGSRWGFILAASGSAIGLGNIVFFSANAWRFGAGAFYLPYLIALLVVGVPLMILEFGIGRHTGEAFPQSLRRISGKGGEFVGWWAIMNATFIVMYYVTILAWVIGMLVGSIGNDLWVDKLKLGSDFNNKEVGNPIGFFFRMISSWWMMICVAVVWFINGLVVWRGIKSIEVTTKILVPLMWLLMGVLLVKGLLYPNGVEGVKLLFTPQFEAMKEPDVWQGAFAQIFFSLSLGFGIMTAYASRLDEKTDIPSTAMSTSFLNCSFEMVAGVAMFALLFEFVVVPSSGVISMMFWVVPKGIAQMGDWTKAFGVLFFVLLFLAGLSSSISLVEALASASIDKFGVSRKKIILVACIMGVIGSACFAIPTVVNPKVPSNATLGFTLVDLIDHWAFSYGLMIVGLIECLIIGWGYGVEKISSQLNETGKAVHLGTWFTIFIKYVIPLFLIGLLGWVIYGDVTKDGLYGHDTPVNLPGIKNPRLDLICFAVWLGGSVLAALALTLAPAKKQEEAQS